MSMDDATLSPLTFEYRHKEQLVAHKPASGIYTKQPAIKGGEAYRPWRYYTGFTGIKQVPQKNRNLKKIAVAPDLKAIGRRIREIRGFDLTQTEFGEMLGISQTQLSDYELGRSTPTVHILLKLKTFSGKSVDWILTGDEPNEKH